MQYSQAINKEQEEVIESEQPSDVQYSQAINKKQEKVFESHSFENKKTKIEHIRPIINENHHKSMLLVNVLWATLLLISIITVRSIYIDQVVDADQNLEKLLAFKQNNTLLEEQLKTMHIEKKQLESNFQGLEQSINDQLMKQKELEAALPLEKSQPTKQAKPEVIVFKLGQNNCCFCSCGTSAFEESLQNSR